MQKLIERLIAETGLAGAAVAIVDGDKVEKHFFGYADPKTKREITSKSYFEIASNSKAFTAMLGAQAADAGLFDWDAPVRRYLPEFSMPCQYVSTHVSGRDLASHRTGAPRHDFMRERVSGSRRDTVMRSAFMEFSYPFRTKYQYNNQQYIVLGYVLEQILGKTWEQLVVENIAKPLGMDMRLRYVHRDMSDVDAALPHYTDGFAPQPGSWSNSPTSGPAGGVRTNLDGMLLWLGAMMNKGAYQGGRLCSESAWEELIRPAISAPNEIAEGGREKSNDYCLAWHRSVYNGEVVINHSGSLSGFNSRVGFIPRTNKGFVALMNTAGTPASALLNRKLMDIITSAPETDYGPDIDKWKHQRDEAVKKAAEIHALPSMGKGHEAMYSGRFYHPAFDDFTVRMKDDALWMEYGSFKGKLVTTPEGAVRAYEGGNFPGWAELTPSPKGMFMMNPDSTLRYEFIRME